jgi:rhodanese-related sulfurtransferase
MKNVWFAIVMIALWSSVGLAQEADTKSTEQAHELTRAEFDALLAHPERLLIVDVRRPDELTAIGGFGVYLSIQPADVEKSLALIPRERTIVTVSNHANRAIRVANVLAANGYMVAGTVGAQNYEEQGGTLIKIAPRQAAAPQAADTAR